MKRVTEDGTVTIPKTVRDRLDIQPGDEVRFEMTDDGILIRKVTELPFERWRGVAGDHKSVERRMQELRGNRR